MFKIGDRVKLVNYGEGGYLKDGDIGIVIEIGNYWSSGCIYQSAFVNFNINYQRVYLEEKYLILVDESNNQQEKTMDKFYRLLKDHLYWSKGAILQKDSDGTYAPTSDIWNVESDNQVFIKFIESGIIKLSYDVVENCPEWFERVYKVSSFKGVAYVLKDKMKEIMSKMSVNADGKIEEGENDDKK